MHGQDRLEKCDKLQNDATFYQTTLHLKRGFSSAATLRRRRDASGKTQRNALLIFDTHLMKSNGIESTPMKNDIIPVDMDVTSIDNSNTPKRWFHRLIKSPWLIHLWKRISENTISCQYRTSREQSAQPKRNARLFTANDKALQSYCRTAIACTDWFRQRCAKNVGIMFESKNICNRIVYETTERTSAPDGQMSLIPEWKQNSYRRWTTPAKRIQYQWVGT